jgi:hypothetical protein
MAIITGAIDHCLCDAVSQHGCTGLWTLQKQKQKGNVILGNSSKIKKKSAYVTINLFSNRSNQSNARSQPKQRYIVQSPPDDRECLGADQNQG